MKRTPLLLALSFTAAGLVGIGAASAQASADAPVCYEQVTEHHHQKHTRERRRPNRDAEWGPWSEWAVWSPPSFRPWTTDDSFVIEGPAPHGAQTNRREGQYRYQLVDTRTIEQETPCPPPPTTTPETTTPPTTAPPTTAPPTTVPDTTTPSSPPDTSPPSVAPPTTAPAPTSTPSVPTDVSPAEIVPFAYPTITRASECGQVDTYTLTRQDHVNVTRSSPDSTELRPAEYGTHPLPPGVSYVFEFRADPGYLLAHGLNPATILYTGDEVEVCVEVGQPPVPAVPVVTDAPTPSPTLPETGADSTTVLALLAGLLVLVGGGAVLLARRAT